MNRSKNLKMWWRSKSAQAVAFSPVMVAQRERNTSSRELSRKSPVRPLRHQKLKRKKRLKRRRKTPRKTTPWNKRPDPQRNRKNPINSDFNGLFPPKNLAALSV